MSKPVVLQVGPYPEWDQAPLDKAFDIKRLFEAGDQVAFMAGHGPSVRGVATRGELGADQAMITACSNLVFEGEPALDPQFLALDNVLLQPHHASGTIETRKAMGKLVRDNLTAHFAGDALLTPVN